MNRLPQTLRRFAPGVVAFTTLLLVVACRPSSTPDTGTLEVRVSDHRVAIGDFESLDVTLTSIGVHPVGQPRTEGWLTFAPQTTVLDLTQYLDDREATVLTTALPAGEYDAARLTVAGGEGQLKVGGKASVEGFSQAAALRFTVRGGQTTVILLDLLVESADDHPGGGYSLNLLNATTKNSTPTALIIGAGLVLLIAAMSVFGVVVIRYRRQVAMAALTKG